MISTSTRYAQADRDHHEGRELGISGKIKRVEHFGNRCHVMLQVDECAKVVEQSERSKVRDEKSVTPAHK